LALLWRAEYIICRITIVGGGGSLMIERVLCVFVNLNYEFVKLYICTSNIVLIKSY